MSIDQWFIMILGGIAIFLNSNEKHNIRKYGYIFGFISQPFWIYSFSRNGEQLGMLILAIWYTISFANGIYTHWIKKT